MCIFVHILRVFFVFCSIHRDFQGLDGVWGGVVGRANSEQMDFRRWGWRFSSGRRGSVSERCRMSSWSTIRRTCIFVCVCFAYFACFFVILEGSMVFREVSLGSQIVKKACQRGAALYRLK